MSGIGKRSAGRLAAYRAAERTCVADERDGKIMQHLPLVHSVVEKIAAYLPSSVERDDLFHAGVIGLMDAIDRFDHTRETAFSTYAVLRIRGSVIDELRARDWVPRSTRSRARDYQVAVNHLHHELGRLPSDDELASHLGIPLAELADLERSSHLASQVSLDSPVGDNATLGDVVGITNDAPPSQRLERDDQRSALLEILKGLKEQERLVIKMYYFENMLMKEIAEVLGVTESRVCQIHARLMTLLRARCQRAGLGV
ncbi:MAG: FliA/WhiG family RNA polymerase sigma factor [Planctomycetota bacterium]|nr:MAG: FliA/WhiG family RNA polymerase sigma factor [Planctomycetota bacterium]